MEQYKGFWIRGEAKLIHPFNPEFYPEATVYKQGRGSSIFQVGSFELPNFTMEKELAEFFGLELAKIVVDECFITSAAPAG